MSYSGPPPGPQDWQSQSQPGHPNQPGHYDPAGPFAQNPYGQPAGYGEPGAPGSTTTSGKATASLVLGIVAIVSLCVGLLFGIPAIILGILARKDIKRSQGRLSGDGMAIGGIVTGVIGALLSLLILGLLVAGVAFSSSVKDVVDETCNQLSSDADPSNDCA